MKISKYIYYIILVLLLAMVWASGSLAYQEWLDMDSCPRILGVPTCYIVLLCFILGLGAHKAQEDNGQRSFLFFIGVVWTISSYGSLGEILDFAQYPKTDGNTSMCFISWSVCSTLVILKIFERKLIRNDQ